MIIIMTTTMMVTRDLEPLESRVNDDRAAGVRYRLSDPSKPLHCSATCVVFKARDVYLDTNLPVVLKLMNNRDQFDREVSARAKQDDDDGSFVVPILQTSNDIVTWTAGAQALNFPSHCFGIVMEFADRNLDAIMRQVTQCVLHVILIDDANHPDTRVLPGTTRHCKGAHDDQTYSTGTCSSRGEANAPR